ncbi:MAG: ferrous iron transport protein B [Desulfovibrio sp.]
MTNKLSIALAGNPNCGKTTMFNALTGARQHVGNWPGVTVEQKYGTMKSGDHEITVIDLPGTYSLTAFSEEELVARNFLIDERPDVIASVLNADCLERNLYLTVQFLELGVPVVMALNMMDELEKSGKKLNIKKLSELTGCPAVPTIARLGKGKGSLVQESIRHAAENKEWTPLKISYGADLDPVLDEMEEIISKANFMTDRVPARWVGVKYLEADEELIERGTQLNAEVSAKLQQMSDKVAHHIYDTLAATPDSVIADYRYGFIATVIKEVVSYPANSQSRISSSDKIDKVLTNALLGPVIMGFLIYFIYDITFTLGEYPAGWLEALFGWMADLGNTYIPEGLFQSLVVSGMIDGVGGVMGFVPLIMIMFFMISILEDSGYVARMAYMLDRVFRAFGLHGNSILPFIVSGGIAGGCAVPGVMAIRTLRSPKEKLATMLVAPFMVCGAKVPVFLMLVAAFFPGIEAKVMFGITGFAWLIALMSARVLRWTIIKGESTPFVMELPPYRIPTLRGVLIHTWERSWEYIRKAGTIILGISILIWAATTFPQLPEERVAAHEAARTAVQEQITTAEASAAPAEVLEALNGKITDINNEEAMEAAKNSAAGRLGTALEPVSSAAGFNWRTNIALIGGFAAKEVIVASLGTTYSLGEVDTEESQSLGERILKDPTFTVASAVALIIFTLLYSPCFVTVVAMARESSWGWASFSMIFSTILAYVLAVIGFNLTNLIIM